ncbi:MAG: SulP family inorganic anion transporter [Vicingaceae bacterium]|nr:MAG: SulP family inorganic anion transporter [Vicingaceae bacterium]
MKKTFISDLLAGLTVSFAALSLGAAFGIMSGRGAFAGMLGAAIIPIITSLFGGTRLQASGPTAPMTAVTALLVANAYDSFGGDKHLADEFITLVLLLAGVFIILSGIFKLGKYIQLVPQVVVLGFMNGIGVLIWIDQLKKLFGLNGIKPLEGNIVINIAIAFGTLGLIYLIPYALKKLNISANIRRFVPSIFVTIILVTTLSTFLQLNIEHVSLGESYNSFREYIKVVYYDLPVDSAIFTSEHLFLAFPLALQLCLLAYLDSLLTSLVIDKMTKEKTKPNKELIAQGIANTLTGLLQGIPGAQATIRSVLLLKEGAQTRLAGVFVGIFALLGFIVFGKLITLITSAVFVGVLLKAGLDVFDRDFAIAYVKNKWMTKRKRNVLIPTKEFCLFTKWFLFISLYYD